MSYLRVSSSAFLIAFAASLPAQPLPPVRDLPRTIGSASKTRGPLMFCTLPDPGIVGPAYRAAAKGGKRPFVVGWELKADPPQELARVVLITSLPQTGGLAKANCKRVQPLPSGGADAMQLHTPYAAVDKAIDWAGGYTSLVMTARNDALPAQDYVPRLKRHVRLVTQLFEPNGMDGYVVYMGQDFEWAYLHWIDRETSVKAFATPEGKTGPADSASFQHVRGASVQIFPGELQIAQDSGMTQADMAFAQALAKADSAALAKLLDAEFTWTTSSGKVLTRMQVLQQLPKHAIVNRTGVESKPFAYGDLGDVQINSGRAHVLRVWVNRPSGWKAIVYQELMALEAPPKFTPGAGKDCENPCQTISFTPANDTERQVAQAYSKLETAAHARNSAGFAPMVADEFIAASSNSDRLQTKRSRIEEFDRSKDAGVAPTPLLSARMFSFGDAVLMVSSHQPDRGNRLHVTRIWVKRNGSWVETLSYQTATAP